MQPGLHLVHKPADATSFQLVRAAVQELRAGGGGKLPVGHGGTLDPFAEGLLLLLVGQATRLMELLHPLPKSYLAEVVWGQETDTGDLHGLPAGTAGALAAGTADLEAALVPFLGWSAQVPPATSAKKIAGEAAYRKAHRGEAVDLPPSRVYLHTAAWVRHELPHRSWLELTCRGGYYVRSLARDLGRVLGCGAHLARLHRTAIGPWEDPGPGARVHLAGPALLPWCRSLALTAEQADHLAHGRSIPVAETADPLWELPAGFPDPQAPIAALFEDRLVALLREAEGRLHTHANLRGGL